ncbi:MAG TPA: hypothetical protein VFF06_02425 [Polyangia bacterium]|nr:hypothetical protein [Polyangia bacterium]
MKTNVGLVIALTFAACSSGNGIQGNGDGGGGGDLGQIQQGDTVTLTLDPFTVQAGGEVFKYQDFVNPFGGVDTEVSAWESHMSTGSHHLLVFYQTVTSNQPLVDGNGLMFGPTPYGAQQPDLTITYPDGVAALVPGNQGIRIQAHYLNASPNTINPTVKVVFHIAKAGTVTQHAGVFFMLNPDVTTAPMSTRTVTKSCPIPFAANLIYATGHMHQHATDFTATTNGTMFYQTSDWSQAPTRTLSPPLQVTAGQMLTWSCTFDNQTSSTLIFGESAQTNEMCILSGQYYPVPAGSNPLIGCN